MLSQSDVATADVRYLVAFISRHNRIETLAGHFHDTYGQALPNVVAALRMGVRLSTLPVNVVDCGQQMLWVRL